MIDHYRAQGRLVDIDGMQDIDVVTAKMESVIKERVGN